MGQAELVPEAEAPAPISSAALAPSGLAALPSTVTNSQGTGTPTRVALQSAATVVDPSGVVRRAVLGDYASDTLTTNQDNLILVVDAGAALSSTPAASAISADCATVTNVAPVASSNNQQFQVGVQANSGCEQVSVQLQSGQEAANGFRTLSSNRLTVNIDKQPPQTSVTTTQQVTSATSPTVTISFSGRVLELNPQRLYTLTGVDRTDTVYNVDTGTVYVTAYLPEGSGNTDITVTVPAGVTTDLAGNFNTAASLTVQYRPMSTAVSAVSKSVNGVVGGAVAVGVATSLVAGLSRGVITTTPLYMLLYGQAFYYTSFLNVGRLPENYQQIASSFNWLAFDITAPWRIGDASGTQAPQVYTTGFPATPVALGDPFDTGSSGSGYSQLPTEASAVALAPGSAATGTSTQSAASQPGRKMLARQDMASPRRALLQTSVAQNVADSIMGQRLVVSSTGVSLDDTNTTATTSLPGSQAVTRAQDIQAAALGSDIENPYLRITRIIVWVAIGLAAVTLVHIVLLLLFVTRRWTLPDMLYFPRPQLFVMALAVPATAEGAANLFQSGSPGDIAVGVILVVFIPVVFLAWSFYLIFTRVVQVPLRKAAFILDEEKLQGKRKHNWVIHVLGVLLLGRSHPEGTWAVVRRADSRFLQKYGALFTDNRGPPMVLKGATYQADPVTGWVNRGKLESQPGQPLLSFGHRRRLYRYQLQAFASLFDLINVVAQALLLKGIAQNPSYGQVIALMVLSLVSFLYLRLLQPCSDRADLIAKLVGELMSFGVFVCGIILITGPSENDHFRLTLGIIMLALKGFGFVVQLMVQLESVSGLVRDTIIPLAAEYLPCCKPRGDVRFAKTVWQVMERDEHILARKYCDRWMSKTLKVGLFRRSLHRRELEDARQQLYANIWAAAQPLSKVAIKTQIGQTKQPASSGVASPKSMFGRRRHDAHQTMQVGNLPADAVARTRWAGLAGKVASSSRSASVAGSSNNASRANSNTAQSGGAGVAGALKAHGWGSPVTSSTMPASKGQRAADRAAVYIAQGSGKQQQPDDDSILDTGSTDIETGILTANMGNSSMQTASSSEIAAAIHAQPQHDPDESGQSAAGDGSHGDSTRLQQANSKSSRGGWRWFGGRK